MCVVPGSYVSLQLGQRLRSSLKLLELTGYATWLKFDVFAARQTRVNLVELRCGVRSVHQPKVSQRPDSYRASGDSDKDHLLALNIPTHPNVSPDQKTKTPPERGFSRAL